MASMSVANVASIFSGALQDGAFSNTSAIANWFTSSSAAAQAMSAFASIAAYCRPAQQMAVLLISASSTTAPLSPSGGNMQTLLANIGAVASYIASHNGAGSNNPVNDLVNGPSYIS